VALRPATNCKKQATLTELIVWSCDGLIVVILHRELSGSAAVLIHVDKLPQNSDVFLYINFLKRFYGRVAQSVWCLATGWMTGRSRFDLRQRRKDFSSSLCIQTGSGAHPSSCTMGTGGPFPEAKARLGRDADHSLPSSAEVENE
jgi:hypothetical protein